MRRNPLVQQFFLPIVKGVKSGQGENNVTKEIRGNCSRRFNPISACRWSPRSDLPLES